MRKQQVLQLVTERNEQRSFATRNTYMQGI